jgi:hypothetical protein
MLNKHQLSLEVPDTNNCSVFRVFDTSLYSTLIPVDCGTLNITSPGFNQPVSIEVLPHFNLILNGCTLGIQTSGCGSVSELLPDGIYNIKYSVSPNNEVYVEYNYLRICMTLNKYFNELCKLELAACEPEADVKEQLDELRLIKSFLDAAKVKVEYCENPQEGMDLFMYAQDRLKKIGSTC